MCLCAAGERGGKQKRDCRQVGEREKERESESERARARERSERERYPYPKPGSDCASVLSIQVRNTTDIKT